jgi:hypothetical protein
MALLALETGAAERHALVQGHVVADLRRLADHDPHAVVDEHAGPDARARVYLDPVKNLDTWDTNRAVTHHPALHSRCASRWKAGAWTPG